MSFLMHFIQAIQKLEKKIQTLVIVFFNGLLSTLYLLYSFQIASHIFIIY
jgi:hypothetical protein